MKKISLFAALSLSLCVCAFAADADFLDLSDYESPQPADARAASPVADFLSDGLETVKVLLNAFDSRFFTWGASDPIESFSTERTGLFIAVW